jgi:biopolymer transport protein ExbD/biopolymer transport protein TolR
MAMNLGPRPEINMTPMIDILLVLIIIFMVMPHKSRGLDAQVPQPSSDAQPQAVQQDIVLTVEGGGNVLVNQDTVAMDQLAPRLMAIFKITARPVVFIRGKKDLAFQEVAQVIDIAKGAGFQRIALMNE